MKSRLHWLGFTLVELLVAIAIVVVLMAILVPCLSAARWKARETQCMNNLRTIGHALELYRADNEDMYPPYSFYEAVGGRRGVMKERLGEWKKSLLAYKVADEQFYCPFDKYARTDHPSEWINHVLTSYAMDLSFELLARGGADGAWLLSGSEVPSPGSQHVLHDECELVPLDSGKHARVSPHGKTIMALFADGHVKAVPTPKP